MFCERNVVDDSLANEDLCQVVIGFTETTLPMQLRDLVQGDRNSCFFTHRVRKHLFIKKRKNPFVQLKIGVHLNF